MKRAILLILFSTGLSVTSSCQFSPGYYALKDVSVIDGISKNVLSHYTIIIHSKYIEVVGPEKAITIPDSAIIYNYPGKYVMPGLIDTHVHLATDPSNDDNRIRAEKDLKDMLLSGITSVRDMAANLILLSANPSLEIDNLDKVVLVIKNGKVYNTNK